MQSYGLILSARSRLGCASFGCRQRGSVSINAVDIDGELARLAAGTTRADEMLEVSWRLMAVAQDAQWSQAAAYHGRALYAQGRIAEGFAMFEEAWQRADRLDDPVAGALATRMGAACSFMLYDYVQAEQWCRRELERRRSRLIAGLRSR